MNHESQPVKSNAVPSFEIITVAVHNAKMFFWIAVSVSDAAAVNPNGARSVLANGARTCSIIGRVIFINLLLPGIH